MREIIIIAHNLRSTHNVGSLFRTADAMGVKKLFLTGYTPYPTNSGDKRLPHESRKITDAIHKTALGAENALDWHHSSDVFAILKEFTQSGYTVVALEQNPNSISLADFKPPAKTVLLLGREVEGIEPAVLEMADVIAEIPMLGRKESLNVVQAAAMALYHFRFH